MMQESETIKNMNEPSPRNQTRKSYANAHEVLPPELLASIQQHFGCGLLYIPPPAAPYYAERRQLVLALSAQGVKTAEIARLACVTPRRVRQIRVQAEKENAGVTDLS
jgi:hypothetical protein